MGKIGIVEKGTVKYVVVVDFWGRQVRIGLPGDLVRELGLDGKCLAVIRRVGERAINVRFYEEKELGENADL